MLALNLTEWLNWKLREGATTTIERTASYEFEASGRPRHPEAGRERRIYRDEAEVTTASGLFLASDAKEKPQTGTIIAVGEGKMDKDGKLLPMPVKVGDKVIYGKFGGTEVTLDGENVLILRADDIYAVVE